MNQPARASALENIEKQPTILVADDNEVNIHLIQAQLGNQGYQIAVAMDGQEALDQAYAIMPDLILLDVMMPKMDGYEVCHKLKNDYRTLFIPIVMLTALSDMQDKIKALEMGADDFITKPFNKLELRTRVKSLIRIKQLHDELENSADVIGAMILALEAKDTYTKGHSERVADLAVRLSQKIGLDESCQKRLHRAGLLHDIGKIGTSESILHKEDKLTEEEINHVKEHTEWGHKILSPLKSMAPLLNIVRSYHERCDGKGYPDGLTREQIPLEARVLAIADTYDSMTSDRPYRKGVPHDEVLRKMTEFKGTGQFDDEILTQFLEMMKEGVE